jgi:hypothetical protein
MSLPVSVPVTPAQPNAAAYATSDLDLIPQYSRASYEGMGWGQPPPFNPAVAIKTWFITDANGSPLTGTETYNVIANGAMAVTQITMDGATAASVNFPGAYRYAVYAPHSAATPATSNGSPINGTILCALADATALATMLGAPAPTQAMEGSQLLWNGETGREWQVTVPGSNGAVDAAPLLVEMFANGIGSPGSWNVTNPNAVVWVPSLPSQDLTGIAVTPVPIRPLLPNEVIQNGPLGMGIEIGRTDWLNPTPTAPASAGGGLTDQQAAQLTEIFNWVMKQGG